MPVGSTFVAEVEVSEDAAPYQSLYRRFRPSTFSQVRGQDHVVLALRNAVRDGRVAHAYLFSGPRGTGKTSTARILAKALNCTALVDGEPCDVCSSCVEITRGSSMDVHELDAASNNGVDAMRDLVSRAALGTPGRQKVYIVDEVHMLSTAASNALLKTLEEPPAHVVFVLATTDPQKVLPTIRSRTQHYEFRLLGADTLGALLTDVSGAAHLGLSTEAIDLAVRRGKGSARDALSILDQVAASEELDDDLPDLEEIVDGIAERDAQRALVAVAHLISSGYSPQQLSVDLIDLLRQSFLVLASPDLVSVTEREGTTLAERARRMGLATVVRSIEVLGQAQVTLRDAPDPRVHLEVALVRLAHPDADDSPASILARLERLERLEAGRPEGPLPAPASSSTSHPAEPPASPLPSAPGGPHAGTVHTSAATIRQALQHDRVDAPVEAAALPPTPATDGPRKTLGALRREAQPATPAHSSPTPPAVTSTATPAPAADAIHGGPGSTSDGTAAAERVSPGDAPTPERSGELPTRAQVEAAWGEHIVVRLRPKAKALYQSGRFLDPMDGVLLLALPNEFHRDRCEEVRSEVEAALSEYFHTPVPLRLLVDAPEAGSERASDAVPAATPPSSVASDESRPADLARALAARPVDTTPEVASDDLVEEDDVVDLDDLGEVVQMDNTAEARILSAFPGAEEV